jgi:hypothetical protein
LCGVAKADTAMDSEKVVTASIEVASS